MDFILTLEGEQCQSLLRFLQGVNFVRLRPAESPRPASTEKSNVPKTYPYFGACPDWGIEAEDLRKPAWPNRAT